MGHCKNPDTVIAPRVKSLYHWQRNTQWSHDRPNGPITIAIRARFEYDSTTIRLQHATTRYEVFRALAYEIVYENQW